MLVLRIPGRYMSKDASEGEKELFEVYKKMLNEMIEGKRAGMILPSECNPETKQPLFSLEYIADTSKP